jgi:hypothetical protein
VFCDGLVGHVLSGAPTRRYVLSARPTTSCVYRGVGVAKERAGQDIAGPEGRGQEEEEERCLRGT